MLMDFIARVSAPALTVEREKWIRSLKDDDQVGVQHSVVGSVRVCTVVRGSRPARSGRARRKREWICAGGLRFTPKTGKGPSGYWLVQLPNT